MVAKAEIYQLFERFDRVENKLDTHTTTLTGILTHLAVLNGSTKNVEKRVDKLEQCEEKQGERVWGIGRDLFLAFIGAFLGIGVYIIQGLIR